MIKKVLVIRFSSIGDIVLTTPVLRCLKKQMPGIEIHYLSKSNYQVVLENNPYIDKIHYLNQHPIFKAAALKNENYDLVIDLHHNLRTTLFKAVLGVKAYSFNKLNWQKFLAVFFKIKQLPNLHIVDRYLATLNPLPITNDGLGLDYFIPEKDAHFPDAHQNLAQEKYVAWAIGGQHFTKRLPANKVIEMAAKVQDKIVLLGGIEDQEAAQKIANTLGAKCINLAGQLNLNESAFVVQNAQQLYTNDTGLLHIGAALKKPIVSFWGNTIPAFGMGPYYGNAPIPYQIIENNNLSCRPCSKIGFNKCPKGHFACMENLSL